MCVATLVAGLLFGRIVFAGRGGSRTAPVSATSLAAESVDVKIRVDAPEEATTDVPATEPPLSSASATTPATPAPTKTPRPMPTPFSVPVSSPYSPRPLTPDHELAQQIAQTLAGHAGKYGIAIEDLSTGRSVLIDPDGEYQAASLFKLTVMYEVYKQRELGALSFGEELVLTERHVAYDLGTLDRPAGSTIELDEALERMITISDNSSAILLSDRVGATNINRDMQGIGLRHTRLILDDVTTSPGDMLTFMEMLARGQGIDREASAEMIQLLSRQRVNDRIPRLLPAGTTVAHKTGNLPGVVNDAGIIYGPDATVIVVVLANGTPEESTAAQLTANIAAAAYARYRSGGSSEVQYPTADATATAPPPANATASRTSASDSEAPVPTAEKSREAEAPTLTLAVETLAALASPTPSAAGAATLSPTATPQSATPAGERAVPSRSAAPVNTLAPILTPRTPTPGP